RLEREGNIQTGCPRQYGRKRQRAEPVEERAGSILRLILVVVLILVFVVFVFVVFVLVLVVLVLVLVVLVLVLVVVVVFCFILSAFYRSLFELFEIVSQFLEERRHGVRDLFETLGHRFARIHFKQRLAATDGL